MIKITYTDGKQETIEGNAWELKDEYIEFTDNEDDDKFCTIRRATIKRFEAVKK